MAFSKGITAEEYHEKIAGKMDHVVVDTRSPILFQRSHLPDSINIRLQELRRHVRQVPQGKTIVILCGSGLRSQQAADILLQAGFRKIYYILDSYEDMMENEEERQ